MATGSLKKIRKGLGTRLLIPQPRITCGLHYGNHTSLTYDFVSGHAHCIHINITSRIAFSVHQRPLQANPALLQRTHSDETDYSGCHAMHAVKPWPLTYCFQHIIQFLNVFLNGVLLVHKLSGTQLLQGANKILHSQSSADSSVTFDPKKGCLPPQDLVGEV